MILLALLPVSAPPSPAPNQKVTATFVSFFDNGAGNTLVVKAKRGKKLTLTMPPDGSGAGLDALKPGDKLRVTFRKELWDRVVDARLATKPRLRRAPRGRGRLHRVTGLLQKIVQGDLGKYIDIVRAAGRDKGKTETWLADFDPTGGLDPEKDKGKKVVLSYVKEKKLAFVS